MADKGRDATTADDAGEPGPVLIGGLADGGQSSAAQPYSEPELDEYGVPVQSAPRGRRLLEAGIWLACAVLQVYAFIDYKIREHPEQHVPVGLRAQTLGAGLIGLIVVVLMWRRKPPEMPAKATVIGAICVVAIFVIVSATVLLLIAGFDPRGMASCHAGCGQD